MIFITLTDAEQTAVQAARRDPQLTPSERDRVEMVLLSAGGSPVPQIAKHLGYCRATVRTALKRFGQTGVPSFHRQAPGPPQDAARREQVTAALDRLLSQERTWTAAQLAATLQEEGITLGTRQTRRYLQAMGARWRRTRRTLAHKQDAARVAKARDQLTRLKKSAPRGSFSSPILTSAASAPANR
jgi:transposase